MTYSIYKEGNTFIDDNSNARLPKDAIKWGEIAEDFSNWYTLKTISFANPYKFELAKSFTFTYHNDSFMHESLYIVVKDKNNTSQIEYITPRPFCPSFRPVSRLVANFLTDLQYFDSASDAKEYFETLRAIDYNTPEALIKKLAQIVNLVEKYADHDNFPHKSKMMNWIECALERFGYSIKNPEPEVIEPNLSEICKALNDLGYIVRKK
ncbi:MAG: hypothetical protein K2N35_04985 [Muribaculaceae bacterium]|nr:hypothetical protein [Muribaculaceae bacterium]